MLESRDGTGRRIRPDPGKPFLAFDETINGSVHELMADVLSGMAMLSARPGLFPIFPKPESFRKTNFSGSKLCFLLLFIFHTEGQIGFIDTTFTWTEMQYFVNGYERVRHTISSWPGVLNDKHQFEIFSPRSEFGGNWDPTWILLLYED